MWYSFPISFLFVSFSSPSSSSFSCTVFSEFAGIFVVVAVVCLCVSSRESVCLCVLMLTKIVLNLLDVRN